MSADHDLLFSKAALKKIVFCAFIMSGIDGFIDESEVEVIRAFADRYWRDEFGNPDDLFLEIDRQVVDLVIPSQGKFQLEPEFLDGVLADLSLEEERLLLDLMTAVMEADGIINPAEVSLIKIIKAHYADREKKA
jgi:uncharacterized tellurite resistance protein B-like protein